MKNKVVSLSIMGMMVAILEASKMILMTLPNIELVSLMIILFVIMIGKKTFIVVIAFSILECAIWGFGLWSIGYFYIWPVLVIIALIFKNNTNAIVWAIILGFFGMAFGALSALPILVISGSQVAISYWISGIPFDIVHCISNFLVTIFLFKPLYRVVNKIRYIS